MKQDRFLWGILISIGLLVLLALGLFFVRQGRQDYRPEDTPRGVVYNYILALQKEDYERAYSYLAEEQGRPDFESFQQAFLARQLDFSNVAVQVGDYSRTDRSAVVDLTLLRTGGGPFGDASREMALALVAQTDAGDWKITNMPYPYWGWNWYTDTQTLATPMP